MGRQAAPEQLFYRLRFEGHVPANHLLRKIDRLLDFDSLRSEFAALREEQDGDCPRPCSGSITRYYQGPR